MEPCKTEKPFRIPFGCMPSLVWLGLFLLGFSWILFNSRWMKEPVMDQKPVESVRIVERDLKIEPDWDSVNSDVKNAVEEARTQAEQVIGDGLNHFCMDLKLRVRDIFLPWFLSYSTQQKLRWLSLKSTVKGWVMADIPDSEAVLQGFVAQAFQERVLRPPLAQRDLELLLDRAVDTFSSQLKTNLESIRVKYEIQSGPWTQCLNDLADLSVSMPDSRSVDLDTKALSAVTALGLVELAGKSVSGSAEGVVSRASQSVRTVVARFPILTLVLALWVWDLADHAITVRRIRPELEESLDSYIDRLKESLAEDPDYGLKSVIAKVADQVTRKLTGISTRKKEKDRACGV
ncbi:MAG: hypothetical protein ACC613_03485 [Synergistales bacterium]